MADITKGTRSGHLTVVQEVEPRIYDGGDVRRKSRQFECVCDCGETVVVEITTFYRPRISHNGCPIKDLERIAKSSVKQTARKQLEQAMLLDRMRLVGMKFGSWTVLANEEHGKNRRVLARCACGMERRVLLAAIRHGKSRSCGCKREPRASS